MQKVPLLTAKFWMNFMTGFYGYKNILMTQHKLARVAPCFLKHGFVQAFWRCRRRTYLFPSLVLFGHNHRWCKLHWV